MSAKSTTRRQPSGATKVCSRPTCPKHGRGQPVENFGKNSQSPDGLHWYCRPCQNEAQREWKRANPRKVRRWKKAYDDRQRKMNGKAVL